MKKENIKGTKERTDANPLPEKNGRRRRSRKREETGLKIFLLLVTLIVIIVIIRNIYQRNYEFDENAKALNKESLYKDQVKDQMQQKTDLSDFHFRVSGEGEFPEGTNNPGTLFIENPVDNSYRMQVTIKEKETGEVLYKSPMLAPGKNVSGFSLKTELPKGNQEAVAYIKAFEKDSKIEESIGEITADIHLKVG